MTNTLSAKLIVCERTGRWASALRREWGDRRPRIRETRHLDDAWQELADAGASCLVIEASHPRVAAVVVWLQRLSAERPVARALVVSDGELTSSENLLLLEAGAVWVHGDRRDVTTVARLAARHVASYPAADRTWREQLFARLPWSDSSRPLA